MQFAAGMCDHDHHHHTMEHNVVTVLMWRRPTFPAHQYRTNIVPAPCSLFACQKSTVMKLSSASPMRFWLCLVHRTYTRKISRVLQRQINNDEE